MRSREEEKRMQRNERNGGKEGRGEERKMKRGYQLPKKKKRAKRGPRWQAQGLNSTVI